METLLCHFLLAVLEVMQMDSLVVSFAFPSLPIDADSRQCAKSHPDSLLMDSMRMMHMDVRNYVRRVPMQTQTRAISI
jgi:hypothetical protein